MDHGLGMGSYSKMHRVKPVGHLNSFVLTIASVFIFVFMLLLSKDLLHVQANDIEILKQVCDSFEECNGFNSNGWLKTSVTSYQHGETDLYIKQPNYKVLKKTAQSPNDYREMVNNLKVYIYETKIGTDHHPHRVGGYAVERVFQELLEKSNFRTQHPNLATFFFIPIRCSSYILDYPTEHEGLMEAKRVTANILHEIQTQYPYWSQSSGANHFYICSHDVGAKVAEGLMKNAIGLVSTADYDDPYFIPHKDISIPPTPSSGLSNIHLIGKGGALVDVRGRNILAFFAGDITSGRIRPLAWRTWYSDQDIEIINRILKPSAYIEKLKKAKFCLIFRGKEGWSPRLVEAISMGCVPVIISDHYHLPLQGIVEWSKIAIILPEAQISDLKKVLLLVSSTQLYEMQQYIKSVYHHFIWNYPAQPNDAFHSVMLQLWKRRHVVKYRTNL
uniref:probable glycosyltransferase At5g11130 n=1 Tax=Ciona intestinalis TaxID=7719 RepID=UPI0005219B52|nr:probable glycosyltransferase At5g11130 [Ciona intestinalis]|eukprot:XP_026693130.1 probable glycosyltransferase At5g11130 [Ciona intestinalis]